MSASPYTLIVREPTNGPLIAQRYIAEFDAKKAEMYADMDYPSDPTVVKCIDHALTHGKDLRGFQLKIIDTFDQYSMTMYDDDLIQEIIEEREAPDMHDVIHMLGEFQTNNPTCEVHSIVPIDLKGTFGFVVRKNDGHTTV